MRVEYINPFVETAFSVLSEVLGGEVRRGDLYLKSTSMPVMGVAALVGLAGDVEGRVLFDMYDLKVWSTGQTKKSARIVGDVIGRFHPHGDTAVYVL